MTRLTSSLVLLALCAGAARTARPAEAVLYRFQGGTDGALPYTSPLVRDQAGNLYGTTSSGGSSNCPQGCGTVFKLSPPAQPGGSWTETVIYEFQGGADGCCAQGVLRCAQSRLLGTTYSGGSESCTGGCGTLFELTPPISGGAWTKTVLYNFPGGANGFAISGLIQDYAGDLYGVNMGNGGAGNNGAVAKLIPPRGPGYSWTEEVLYRFKGVPLHQTTGDGSRPLGLTFDQYGNLFGATFAGGFCTLGEGGSCYGSIFELTPLGQAGGAWTEVVVYRMRPGDQNPSASVVVDRNGAVYGVTYTTVYQVANGTLTVLHDYSDDLHGNGMAPEGAVLLDSEGNVYGTTCAGGLHNNGIVFRLAPPAAGSTTWKQAVLHNFAGGTDGVCPEAPLIFGPGGVIYGTTDNGGGQCSDSSFGCGTVFQITL